MDRIRCYHAVLRVELPQIVPGVIVGLGAVYRTAVLYRLFSLDPMAHKGGISARSSGGPALRQFAGLSLPAIIGFFCPACPFRGVNALQPKPELAGRW